MNAVRETENPFGFYAIKITTDSDGLRSRYIPEEFCTDLEKLMDSKHLFVQHCSEMSPVQVRIVIRMSEDCIVRKKNLVIVFACIKAANDVRKNKLAE